MKYNIFINHKYYLHIIFSITLTNYHHHHHHHHRTINYLLLHRLQLIIIHQILIIDFYILLNQTPHQKFLKFYQNHYYR
jgi:hypothetical protein